MNKLYILVAEDDEEDREIMEIIFSKLVCPAEMIFVEDGEKLLQHLAAYKGAFPAPAPCFVRWAQHRTPWA